MNHLVKVARQEVLVRKQFLVLKQLPDLVLLGLAALGNDGHGVVVLLAVENHVESSLVELFHGDLVGALGEDLHLIDAGLLLTLVIGPLTLSHCRRGDKAEDLR